MQITNADIFGVESLKLNQHFSKKHYHSNVKQTDAEWEFPDVLKRDLDIMVKSMNLPTLEIQQDAGYTISAEQISICRNGLTSQEKKKLWDQICRGL